MITVCSGLKYSDWLPVLTIDSIVALMLGLSLLELVALVVLVGWGGIFAFD